MQLPSGIPTVRRKKARKAQSKERDTKAKGRRRRDDYDSRSGRLGGRFLSR